MTMSDDTNYMYICVHFSNTMFLSNKSIFTIIIFYCIYFFFIYVLFLYKYLYNGSWTIVTYMSQLYNIVGFS